MTISTVPCMPCELEMMTVQCGHKASGESEKFHTRLALRELFCNSFSPPIFKTVNTSMNSSTRLSNK